MPVHGVLLVARELCLLDNVTHYTDVVRAFRQVSRAWNGVCRGASGRLAAREKALHAQ
jgi:hypothetical protein